MTKLRPPLLRPFTPTRREEVGLICGLNEEFNGLPQRRVHERTASSLIQRGRPAERHLLPKKLFIKSQLSFCKHFIENKICKLISCEGSPGLRERREREATLLTLTFSDEALFPASALLFP